MSPRPRPPSATEAHRRWLQLVDTEGPFLSIPALRRVWPQGMPALPEAARLALTDGKRDFEKAWDAFGRGRLDADGYAAARDLWVQTVLSDGFGWGNHLRTDPEPVTVRSPITR